MDEFPLVGRGSELNRLLEGFRKHQPVLLLGEAGAGKSALIRSAIAAAPASEHIIRLAYSANLHQLLVGLARALFEREHAPLRKLARVEGDREKWLSTQTSVHLRGLLWTALESEPRIIVLDGIDSASFPAYRFLQRLYFVKGMTLIAAARDPVSLGALARLFWDPRIIVHLRPLNDLDANRLFDLAAMRFGLGGLNLEEFREKVIEAARGNPGQIVEMCRMASNPMYVSGRHIKFAPLRIDVLMKFI